ncbi:putative addiction module component, TIGR02574 family [Opitutaceae bacterium TAV1]|nr:putative addiction module component, TIGR02574 family [Opitutaceae bacterium TAV1]
MLPTVNAVLAAEISRLLPTEKILLVEDIWDQIAADGDALPLPAAHRAELDRRLASDASDPGRPWSEVRDELLRR